MFSKPFDPAGEGVFVPSCQVGKPTAGGQPNRALVQNLCHASPRVVPFQEPLRSLTLPLLAGRDTPPASQDGAMVLVLETLRASQQRNRTPGRSSFLSGIVLSPHGQLVLIWFTGNPIHPFPQVPLVITGDPPAAQALLQNHQGPASGALCSGTVFEERHLMRREQGAWNKEHSD